MNGNGHTRNTCSEDEKQDGVPCQANKDLKKKHIDGVLGGAQEDSIPWQQPNRVVPEQMQLLEKAKMLLHQAKEATDQERSRRLALDQAFTEYRLQQAQQCQGCQENAQLRNRISQLESQLEEEHFLGNIQKEEDNARLDALEQELKASKEKAMRYESLITQLQQNIRRRESYPSVVQESSLKSTVKNQNVREETARSIPQQHIGEQQQDETFVVLERQTKAMQEESPESSWKNDPDTVVSDDVDAKKWEQGKSPAASTDNTIHSSERPLDTTCDQDMTPTSASVRFEEMPEADTTTLHCVEQQEDTSSCVCDEIYVGSYNDKGERHGEGELHYSNGEVYKGSFVNNKRHGLGTLRFSSAGDDSYVGEWKNDQMEGSAVRTFDGGAVYEGEYRNGKRNGFGSFTFANGDIYRGHSLNNKRHGSGSYIYLSGARFEGHFCNDKRTGIGKFITGLGSCKIFLYLDDKRLSPGLHWSADRSSAWKLIDPDNKDQIGISTHRSKQKKPWQVWKSSQRRSMVAATTTSTAVEYGRRREWIFQSISEPKATKLLNELELAASRSQMVQPGTNFSTLSF